MIAGLAIAFAIVGFFGLFGLGVWRMVDPSKWAEGDTGRPRRSLSAWDQFRSVVWWTMIVATVVVGFPAVIIYLADPANENRGQFVLVGVGLLAFVAVAIRSWTARCKRTGERVFLCHCPDHSE